MRHLLAVILILQLALGTRAQSLRFDSLALHLPALSEGDTTAHAVTFCFRNAGTDALLIGKVTTTCGCTKVTYRPAKAVAVGKCDSIVVQYKSDRTPGTIDEPVFVYAEGDADTPLATLHVLGEVRATAASQWRHLPAAMGPLRLKRKALTFGADDVVMRIPCANTGAAPLTLKALLLPPYATFSTEPQVIAPNAEADIVVRIDRAQLPVKRPVSAAITLGGVPCDLNSRKITLTIK